MCATCEVVLEVHALGESLHATVAHLRQSAPLVAALRATWTDQPAEA